MSCPAHEMAAAKKLLTSEQVDELISAGEGLPQGPTLVYDLGSGSGLTALCVLQGRQSAVTVVSIDNREQEIYWAGIAMENVGRKDDWRGIVGDVLNTDLVPNGEIEFQHIDLLIIDFAEEDEVDLADVLTVWEPALSPGANVWYNGGFIDWNDGEVDRVETPPSEAPAFGANQEESKTEASSDEETPTDETTTASEETVAEPLPCDDCDYVTPKGKDPLRALQAHARIHKND